MPAARRMAPPRPPLSELPADRHVERADGHERRPSQAGAACSRAGSILLMTTKFSRRAVSAVETTRGRREAC